MSKKNGFQLYLEGMKPSLLAAGHQLTGGLKDLVDLCSDGWEALSQEEKKKYSDDAKAYNERRTKCLDGARKSDDPTTPPATVPENSQEQDLAVMENGRRFICRMFDNKDWKSQPLVICSFSMYVEPGYAEVFLPAEIGVTAFSLKKGVIDNFARIIDPGQVPMGYGIEAVHTATSLGLPQLGTVPEFADYQFIIAVLETFLQQYNGSLNGGDNLYIFAFESEYKQISRCLEWLFKKTNHRLPIKILSLSLWCYLASVNSDKSRPPTWGQLQGGAGQRKSVTTRVSNHRIFGGPLVGNFVYCSLHPLTKCGLFASDDDVEAVIKDVHNFKYFDELCCVYHAKEGLEIQNCALLSSNRYAFSILEILTLSNEVRIIPGAHFPEIYDSPVEKARRYNMLRRWGITQKEEEMEVRQHGEPEEPTQPRRYNGRRRRSGEQRDDLGCRPRVVGASHREDEEVVQEALPPQRESSARNPRDRHVTFRDPLPLDEEGNSFGSDQYDQFLESEEANDTRLVLYEREDENGDNNRAMERVGGGSSQSDRRGLMAGVDTGRVVRPGTVPSIFYGSQDSAKGKR